MSSTRPRGRLGTGTRLAGLLMLTVLAVTSVVAGGPAHAAPVRETLVVHSPSMNVGILVDVLAPADPAGTPVAILLDGADAGRDSGTRASDWLTKTDAADLFRDKNVTVALPVGGRGSFYTDWLHPDPTLGANRWETFLTEELPAALRAAYSVDTTRSALVGPSMGGHAALTLAARHPGRYRFAGAFSSCPASADPFAQQSIRATVATRGGDPDLMWGPPDDPQWAAHDPLLLAENLRGTALFVTVGSGTPAPDDSAQDAVTGAPLEWGANTCTDRFRQRATELHLPATFVDRPTGLHAWPSWQTDLHDAWPHLAEALDIS
ncbi:alpha/beta hydrolase [Nocardia takedensis]